MEAKNSEGLFLDSQALVLFDDGRGWVILEIGYNDLLPLRMSLVHIRREFSEDIHELGLGDEFVVRVDENMVGNVKVRVILPAVVSTLLDEDLLELLIRSTPIRSREVDDVREELGAVAEPVNFMPVCRNEEDIPTVPTARRSVAPNIVEPIVGEADGSAVFEPEVDADNGPGEGVEEIEDREGGEDEGDGEKDREHALRDSEEEEEEDLYEQHGAWWSDPEEQRL